MHPTDVGFVGVLHVEHMGLVGPAAPVFRHFDCNQTGSGIIVAHVARGYARLFQGFRSGLDAGFELEIVVGED